MTDYSREILAALRLPILQREIDRLNAGISDSHAQAAKVRGRVMDATTRKRTDRDRARIAKLQKLRDADERHLGLRYDE